MEAIVSERAYTEDEIRAREAIKDLIEQHPDWGNRANWQANVLIEIVLSELVKAGYSINRDDHA